MPYGPGLAAPDTGKVRNVLRQGNRSNDDDWRLQFVEEIGALVLMHGTPRTVTRVLGSMVVCEPPEQTATEVQARLGLSAGGVSTALRGLCEMGILDRVARPGDRRIYYRLSAEGWERALEARFRAFTEMRRMAERALDAADGDADERLADMRDVFALMEGGVADLVRQCRARKGHQVPALSLHR